METKFEELAEAYGKMSIKELAETTRSLKEQLDAASVEKTRLQKQYDFLTMDVVPERMEEEGLDSVKVSGVGRLQLSSDIRCSVPSGNKVALKDWLQRHNHGAMVSDSINSSVLKSFVKEQMREGGDYPSHLLNINAYSRATVVKA